MVITLPGLAGSCTNDCPARSLCFINQSFLPVLRLLQHLSLQLPSKSYEIHKIYHPLQESWYSFTSPDPSTRSSVRYVRLESELSIRPISFIWPSTRNRARSHLFIEIAQGMSFLENPTKIAFRRRNSFRIDVYRTVSLIGLLKIINPDAH